VQIIPPEQLDKVGARGRADAQEALALMGKFSEVLGRVVDSSRWKLGTALTLRWKDMPEAMRRMARAWVRSRSA
jgi:hypothetical protein